MCINRNDTKRSVILTAGPSQHQQSQLYDFATQDRRQAEDFLLLCIEITTQKSEFSEKSKLVSECIFQSIKFWLPKTHFEVFAVIYLSIKAQSFCQQESQGSHEY